MELLSTVADGFPAQEIRHNTVARATGGARKIGIEHGSHSELGGKRLPDTYYQQSFRMLHGIKLEWKIPPSGKPLKPAEIRFLKSQAPGLFNTPVHLRI